MLIIKLHQNKIVPVLFQLPTIIKNRTCYKIMIAISVNGHILGVYIKICQFCTEATVIFNNQIHNILSCSIPICVGSSQTLYI